MKGTWGRRVYGRIYSEGEERVFFLAIEFGDNVFHSRIRALEEDLVLCPELYGLTLDNMCEALDKYIVDYFWSDS